MSISPVNILVIVEVNNKATPQYFCIKVKANAHN